VRNAVARRPGRVVPLPLFLRQHCPDAVRRGIADGARRMDAHCRRQRRVVPNALYLIPLPHQQSSQLHLLIRIQAQ